jgi:uncharacterized protein (DUF2062 family)
VTGGSLEWDAVGKKLAYIFTGEDLTFWQRIVEFGEMGGEVGVAFFVGGLLWAAFMTPIAYFGVRWLVVNYRKMRKKISR